MTDTLLRELGRVCGGGAWRTEGRRLFLRSAVGTERLVTVTTPRVEDLAFDEERATCYMTVSFEGADGRSHVATLDRRDLFDESRIVDALAPLGANVSTANASLVVRWLTDLCNDRVDLPCRLASSHMGWVAGTTRAFLPFQGECERLVVPHGMGWLARAFEPSGTLTEWAQATSGLRRDSMACRAMLAASAAAPLVRMLGLRPLALYLHDRRGLVADVALRAAGSVWGDTSSEAGYCLDHLPPLDDTLAIASFLRDVPFLQANLLTDVAFGEAEAKRSAQARLLAHVRGHAPAPASSVTLATGDMRLEGTPASSACASRILEIDDDTVCGTFDRRPMGDVAHRLHGCAGKKIVQELVAFGRDYARGMWREACDRLGPLVHDDGARELVVLVCLGDALLAHVANQQDIPSSFGSRASIDDAADLCRWLRKNTVPYGRRFVDHMGRRHLARWLRETQHAFAASEADGSRAPGHYAGTGGDRSVVVARRDTIAKLFDECCDADITLYDMGDKGLITECPRPAFDHAPTPDAGNDWYRIDVRRVLGTTL